MIITRCKREEIDYKSAARNSAFRLVRRRGKVRMVFGSQESCKNIWESWVLYENEGAHALRQFLCSKRAEELSLGGGIILSRLVRPLSRPLATSGGRKF